MAPANPDAHAYTHWTEMQVVAENCPCLYAQPATSVFECLLASLGLTLFRPSHEVPIMLMSRVR